MPREPIKEGSFVRLKSGTEGWVKGQVVEYFDVIPTAGPSGKGYMYGGGMTPGYKVHILEGKHKGETIRVPENYVEPIGLAKPGGEPLYPHIPKSRQPLFPHVPKGQQPAERLPASRYEFFPESVRRRLPPIGATGDQKDPIVQVKFFTPWTNWTWYSIEFDGKDIFFGWVVGLEKEFGSFSLSELQSLRGPLGLKIERDIYFEPKPISQVMKEHGESLALPQIELLASTEGDPIRKFCCRLCGECAPPELLEEGRFPDRIAWLRSHYKEKHPGIWGKGSTEKLPQTIEGGDLIPPQYQYLRGWISEPLPREAE